MWGKFTLPYWLLLFFSLSSPCAYGIKKGTPYSKMSSSFFTSKSGPYCLSHYEVSGSGTETTNPALFYKLTENSTAMQQNVLDSAIQSLRAAKAELQQQIEDINRAIASLTGSHETTSTGSPNSHKQIPDPQYDSNWSNVKKFLYFLKKHKRFLHFREVADFIVELEGGDVKTLTSRLSSGTNNLKKKGIIVKYKADHQHQNTFWGSPKWLDDDGNVKEGHEINREYLHKGGRPQDASFFEI